MTQMTPQEIVSELDKHIIGQDKAKRAVSIALRNRWRRQQVAEPLRQEITPKNILMIGPTGVGKTEIARRLARLANAPFIKVEATKFTEVGYVGKDVDSIIRDLVEAAIKQQRDLEKKRMDSRARDAAEERILDVLLPTTSRGGAVVRLDRLHPGRAWRGAARRGVGHAAEVSQAPARGRPRRQGDRDRTGAADARGRADGPRRAWRS